VSYPSTDDAGLLAAAAAGEEAAFEVFYRRWLPVVLRFHLRRTRSREVALDLTAETFAAVVVGCRGFDVRRGSAAAWLFGIAEHKLNDSLRRTRVEDSARRRLRLEPVVFDDADLDRVEELAGAGGEPVLRKLLAELPAEQRQAVCARVLDERPYREIAADLRCSEAVVRQRVHRGLARLRERLKETG
jgi:RNA polymerase sigma-70 factor (ECF subfamily)